MKKKNDIVFYKIKEKNQVIAVFPLSFSANSYGQLCYDCVFPVTITDNSIVYPSIVSEKYLMENCEIVSLTVAKGIHPNLIEYLKKEKAL